MKSLSTIKLEIKDIQDSFNPAKSTYRILDDIVNNNHSIEEIVYMISKIHGMSRYPEAIKSKFSNIVSDLKELRAEEIKYIEKKNREFEKQMQDANTKELKDIINLLEKEMKKEGQEAIKKDINIEEKEQTLEEAPSKDEIVKSKTKLLMFLLIVTVIILFLLFLFY